MLKIVQAPDEVLTKNAKPIEKIDKYIHKLLAEMSVALNSARDPEGVGLAAPQVGKSLQLFIVKQSPRSPMLVFINPVIKEFYDEPLPELPKTHKKDTSVQLEGCLSLHNVWGVVKRRDAVLLEYQDEHGTKHNKKFDGFLATIIQHEVDHLQGVLFPKRVLEQKNQLYHSVKNAKGEIEFEEIEI